MLRILTQLLQRHGTFLLNSTHGSFQNQRPFTIAFHQVVHQEQSLGVYVSLAQAFNQFRLTDFDEIVEKNATALRLSDTWARPAGATCALPAALRRLGDVYCLISVSKR